METGENSYDLGTLLKYHMYLLVPVCCYAATFKLCFLNDTSGDTETDLGCFELFLIIIILLCHLSNYMFKWPESKNQDEELTVNHKKRH